MTSRNQVATIGCGRDVDGRVIAGTIFSLNRRIDFALRAFVTGADVAQEDALRIIAGAPLVIRRSLWRRLDNAAIIFQLFSAHGIGLQLFRLAQQPVNLRALFVRNVFGFGERASFLNNLRFLTAQFHCVHFSFSSLMRSCCR